MTVLRGRVDPENPATWIALAVCLVLAVVAIIREQDAKAAAYRPPPHPRREVPSPTTTPSPRATAPASEPPPLSAAERAAESEVRAETLDGRVSPDLDAIAAIFAAHDLTPEQRGALVGRVVIAEVARRLAAAHATRQWSPDDEVQVRAYLGAWGVMEVFPNDVLTHFADLPMLRARWAAVHEALPVVPSALPLVKGEVCHFRAIGAWDEARADGRRVTVREGDVHITNRQVTVVGWQGRKTIRLAEIIGVRHEGDGMWLASGRARSPFIRFAAGAAAAEVGSVVLGRVLTGETATPPATNAKQLPA